MPMRLFPILSALPVAVPIAVKIAVKIAGPVAILAATPAAAHPGHIADALGHDHWVAGAAVGIAILLGLWGALKGGRDEKPEAEAEEAGADAPDEAGARARSGA